MKIWKISLLIIVLLVLALSSQHEALAREYLNEASTTSSTPPSPAPSQAALFFPEDRPARITTASPVEMQAVVPEGALEGEAVAEMPTGTSNGSVFALGSSDVPDDSGIGQSWSLTVSGQIVSDTVWSQNLLVTGDVEVAAGVTLTIEPGVTVFFAAHSDDQAGGLWSDRAELLVWGRLVAQGSLSNPIYFTSAATQTLPGDWGGIIVRMDSVDSSLSHCLVQYAERGLAFHASTEGGGHISGSVSNCTFQHNVNGVHAYGRPDGSSCNSTLTIDPSVHSSYFFSNTYGLSLHTTVGCGTSINQADVFNNLFQANETGAFVRGNSWWLGHAEQFAHLHNNSFLDNSLYGLQIHALGSSDGSGSDTDVGPVVQNNLFQAASLTGTTHVYLYFHPYGSDGFQWLHPDLRYNTLGQGGQGLVVEDTEPYDTLEPIVSHNVWHGFEGYAVHNLTGRTITATHNYWGATPAEWDAGAPPAWISGSVVVTDHLSSASPPVLSRILPAAAQPGETVTLYGANLRLAPPAVVFQQDVRTPPIDLQPMEMRAVVPEGATEGEAVAEMSTGTSNGSVFALGSSDVPDDSGIGQSWSLTVSGQIVSDTVWSQNLLVTGDVEVAAGVTLTIEPGVTVFFAAHSDDQAGGLWSDRAELLVWGRLVAQGSLSNPIYFTSAATQTLPGDWGGIIVRMDSVDSSLSHCLVQYAERGLAFHASTEGGGHISGSVSNCTFQHNVNGVHAYGRPDGSSCNSTLTIDPSVHSSYFFSNTYGLSLHTTVGCGTSINQADVFNNLFQANETGAFVRGNSWWLGHAEQFAHLHNNSFLDNSLYGLQIHALGSSDGSGSDTDVGPVVQNNLFQAASLTGTTHVYLYFHPYGSDGFQWLHPDLRYNTLGQGGQGLVVEDTEPYDTLEPIVSHNVWHGFEGYAVHNLTGRTITATHNYWGATPAEWDAGAPPAWISGSVVVTDHLSSASPPVLSRILPAAAQPGETVTLHGANFRPAPPLVIFQHGQWVPPTDLQPVEMRAVVPEGALEGEAVAEMPTGTSNGSVFALGSSDVPDDSGIGQSWSLTVSGQIVSDTVWSQNLLVTGDVEVAAGVTLTIEPGVTVFFAAHSDDQAGGLWSDRAELLVWGRLVAQGSPASPIYFTSAATQTLPGDWGGIIVRRDSVDSSLSHCLVQHAERGLAFHSSTEGGGHLSASVSNCSFQHNVSGVHTYGRTGGGSCTEVLTIDPSVHSSYFFSNTTGIYLLASVGCGTSVSQADVFNNLFQANETGAFVQGNSWWLGHADQFSHLHNNSFLDNSLYGLQIRALGSSDSSGSDTDVEPVVQNNLFQAASLTGTTHIHLYLHPYGSDGFQWLHPDLRYNTLGQGGQGLVVEDTEPYDTLEPTVSHNVWHGFDQYAVHNLTGRTITATHNYWGATPAEWDAGAPPAWISGSVVVTDHLSSASPPVLSRILPAAAQPGETVTLHGANFADDLPPLEPTLISPANGVAISDTADGVVLVWEASPSFDATGYWLDWDGSLIDVGATTHYTTSPLSDGVYTWTVATYDAAGNSSPYPEPWTFVVDATPPQVPTLLSPADGVTLSQETVTLTWQASAEASGYWLDLNGDVSDVGNTTAYTEVLADGVYTWTVAAYDEWGNASAYADAWGFGVDATLPQVSAVFPDDGASNVAVDALVVITFSEPIDTSTFTYTVRDQDPGGWSSTWSQGDTVVSLNHDPFAQQTTYSLTVTAANDLVGNPLANAPYSWSFGTASLTDTVPPAVLAVSPTNGAEGVAVDATVVVSFSEAIDAATLAFSAQPDPAGWSAAWSQGGSVVSLSHNPFAYETTYSLTITAADDLAGNPLADAPYGWRFDTISTTDTLAPEVLAVSPADGAEDVAIDTTLVLTFSEAVNAATLAFSAQPDPAGWSAAWSQGGSVVSLSHNPFAYETTYSLTITAADDLAGNPLADAPYGWRFDTISTTDTLAPEVLAVSPADGIEDVAVDATIVISFSEAVNAATLAFSAQPDPAGWSASWSQGGSVVSLSHDPFAYETTYVLTITAADDLAGNPLANAPYDWQFATAAGPQDLTYVYLPIVIR